MRLIGQLSSEEEVLGFSAFLFRHGIAHKWDSEEEGEARIYKLWVYEEEDVESAFDYYNQFLLHPKAPRFTMISPKRKMEKKSIFHTATFWMIVLCGIFFLWNGIDEAFSGLEGEKGIVADYTLTSLEEALFFDAPSAVHEIGQFLEKQQITSWEMMQKAPSSVSKTFMDLLHKPFWKGVLPIVLEKMEKGTWPLFPPLFEKIREGEVWRLISPSFMHRDLIHIFFNMAWLLLLGRQIESRIKGFRMIVLVAILATISNTSQYLMSGPYFLGFSGVITGLAAFIWTRQKLAPWEAYSVPRNMLFFLWYFVLILSLIGTASWVLEALHIISFPIPIANTAHVSGGIAGFILGRCSFFSGRWT